VGKCSYFADRFQALLDIVLVMMSEASETVEDLKCLEEVLGSLKKQVREKIKGVKIPVAQAKI
jgi:hypothetical protein